MRIVVAGRNRLYAEGLAVLVQRRLFGESLQIVACLEAEPNEDRRVDIVIVRHGGGPDELENTVRQVREQHPAPRLVVTGVERTPRVFAACLRIGVSGWVCVDDSEERLREVLQRVMRGERSVHMHTGEARPPARNGSASSHTRLTPRQLMIVAAICDGLSNREIGERLEIRTQTVKNHVHNILEKLSMESRLQLAQYALGSAHPGRGTTIEHRLLPT